MRLREVLDDLQSRLAAYFGMVNLIEAHLRVAPEDRVDRPDELKMYDQMEELHLPPWAGGIVDQPHIWLAELAVIRNFLKLQEAAHRTQAPPGTQEGQHGIRPSR